MESFEPFLRPTEIVDWLHPTVLERSRELAGGSVSPSETARRCFEWVRDDIQHSGDFHRDPVTCLASETLREGTGYCFAKSHLLATLLRANGIPAGFCYQRLSIDGTGAPFSLHGLNAVHLPDFGWYRIDARGNKPGVDAQFCPPVEQLAFRIHLPGERAFSDILPDPLSVVVDALGSHSTWDAMFANLPDWSEPSLDSRIARWQVRSNA